MSAIRPGEFSLAHGGVLLADELPEWARDSREALREPLERGKVTLTRTLISIELPARFTLVANGNLCPCGGWPRRLPKSDAEAGSSKTVSSRSSLCSCKDDVAKKYLDRLSGPILDRIDIIRMVAHPMMAEPDTDRLEKLREATKTAQELSLSLWGKPAGLLDSSELGGHS